MTFITEPLCLLHTVIHLVASSKALYHACFICGQWFQMLNLPYTFLHFLKRVNSVSSSSLHLSTVVLKLKVVHFAVVPITSEGFLIMDAAFFSKINCWVLRHRIYLYNSALLFSGHICGLQAFFSIDFLDVHDIGREQGVSYRDWRAASSIWYWLGRRILCTRVATLETQMSSLSLPSMFTKNTLGLCLCLYGHLLTV